MLFWDESFHTGITFFYNRMVIATFPNQLLTDTIVGARKEKQELF
jgi:hypothetical protein